VALLQKIDDALWVYEEPVRVFAVVPTKHRMSAVQLRDGGLVLLSPTHATPELIAELEALGAIKAIVAPSWWHDLYLDEWAERVPSATLYLAPSLVRARATLPAAATLGDNAPELWSGQIGQQQLRGIGLHLDEFAFYHEASRSLILADLLFNYDDTFSPIARTVGRYVLGSYPGCRFATAFRRLVNDRQALRAALDSILEWDFKRIVLGHGALVEQDARDVFRTAFSWLDGAA
jgi:hypothetical protein